MLQKIIPILTALNIKETIMFYENKLGFTCVNKGSYVIMKKDAIELHFVLCTDINLFKTQGCYIKVSDIACLYSDFSTAEIITPNGKLLNKPGGIKEFIIKDNNGNQLRFAQEGL